MMVGVPGFLGERLKQAREARGMTAVDLSELVSVTSASIGNYEHGRQTPRPDVLDAIAKALNMPREFFLKPMPALQRDRILYRSQASATKTSRTKAEARFLWLKEITSYLAQYLDFPTLAIPYLNLPNDPEQISDRQIDDAAIQCRREWNLGIGPIADVLLVLENNGILVTRGEIGSDKLDSFSQYAEGLAYIFLNQDKGNAVRFRFDACHELAHLVLHRDVDKKKIRRTQTFKLIERQAHRFSLSFLLPEHGFTRELFAPSLDGFHALKGRWKVSIAAMIKRCEDLGILDEDQARRAWINLSRRGWKQWEPMDDSIPVEEPRILRRSMAMLLEEGIKSRAQILLDVCIPARDVEDLVALPRGYMSGIGGSEETSPTLKRLINSNSQNVISLWDHKKSN